MSFSPCHQDMKLGELKTAARKARTQRRWPDVVRGCEEYLKLKKNEPEVAAWLAEAKALVQLEQNIVTVDEGAQVTSAFSQLENLVRARDINAAEALFMSMRQRLAPHQALAFQRQILLGKARQAKEKGDWETARRAAGDLHQIDPSNAEAAEILSDGMLEDAFELLRAGRYDDAEAKCKDAAGIAPLSPGIVQFREYLYQDRIDEARARSDWGEVLRVTEKVLADPQLRSLHDQAGEWRREAQNCQKLWGQIQVQIVH